MRKTPTVKWTREQVLIALNLYCKLPFGKFHKGNPLIVEVARRMGRTSSSLAMKLCNLASLDPVQQARGIRGLQGAAKLDCEMWDDFQANLVSLGPESEQLLHDLFTTDEEREVDLQGDHVELERNVALVVPRGATEIAENVRVRRGQQFFRQSILNVYRIRCCISGINAPRLLVASHIKPWRDFPDDRLNPRNGLCLSSLHDAAFDSGLITLDDEFRVVLSKRLKRYFPQPTLEQNFLPFEGQPIQLPEKLAEPSREFVTYHREALFAD